MMTSCTLISFSPDAHEVGTDPAENMRKVKCQELSLTQAEVYQAGGTGLSPEAKLLIPYDREYRGERELEYRKERWKVLRSDPYKDWNGVILLIARKKGNSVPAVPEEESEPVTAAEVGSDA
jgi:SPP1 family predicted phage head-tail adaptor